MKKPSVTDRVLEVCEWIETGRARSLRESAGLTQREVAQSCEVSQGAVLRWERAERRPRGRNALAYHQVLSKLVAREQAAA
ncbi:helix-turn-helix domain-containing protein [Streptomyces sp. NPDC127051]|uniref:helix-turn-helix domain-containing protein n=1 Tax=Streptomyces sp. NPDC127051 TaxID=3347119 RepID=UPI003651505C